jgi:V/A-type H+-transporting ATPase subunit D
MDTYAIPTKGNLMHAKNTLAFSNQGYSLLDQKRNALIKETVSLTEKAASLRTEVNGLLPQAYAALMRANMEKGAGFTEKLAQSIPLDDSINITARTVMGVELPQTFGEDADLLQMFALTDATASLDEVYLLFNRLKGLLITLAGLENAARRLAEHIRKTNKRANALRNITIPKWQTRVKYMQDNLEERERDEFTRLKVIKAQT